MKMRNNQYRSRSIFRIFMSENENELIGSISILFEGKSIVYVNYRISLSSSSILFPTFRNAVDLNAWD